MNTGRGRREKYNREMRIVPAKAQMCADLERGVTMYACRCHPHCGVDATTPTLKLVELRSSL
jgi:hypothetical protein